jgi:uncharacterized protein
MVNWWGTMVECCSAIARMERQDDIGTEEARGALGRLGELQQSWAEIEPTELLR